MLIDVLDMMPSAIAMLIHMLIFEPCFDRVSGEADHISEACEE